MLNLSGVVSSQPTKVSKELSFVDKISNMHSNRGSRNNSNKETLLDPNINMIKKSFASRRSINRRYFILTTSIDQILVSHIQSVLK